MIHSPTKFLAAILTFYLLEADPERSRNIWREPSPDKMVKNFICDWLKGLSCKTSSGGEADMTSRTSCELALLEALLAEPLPEETKDLLAASIRQISHGLRRLKEENRRLRRELNSRTQLRVCRSCLAAGLGPEQWVQWEEKERGGGMVDILKAERTPPPGGRRRRDTAATPRQSRLSNATSMHSTPSGEETLRDRQQSPARRTGQQRVGGAGPRQPEPLKSRPEQPREVKFSKYQPLPALTRPRLIRSLTYDVIDPVYVKGPPEGEGKRGKLPEMRKLAQERKENVRMGTRGGSGRRRSPNKPQSPLAVRSQQQSPVPVRSYRQSTLAVRSQQPSPLPVRSQQPSPLPVRSQQPSPLPVRSYQQSTLSTRSHQRSPVPARSQQSPAPARKAEANTPRTSEKRARQKFDPSSIAPPSDLPSNVFWFPI